MRINQLDRALSNGEIGPERHGRLKQDMETFRASVTLGDPNELLEGLTKDNIKNRMLLISEGQWPDTEQLQGVQNALFDFYIESFETPETGTLTYENLEKALLRYDIEIEQAGADTALGRTLLNSKAFFVEKIQPLYEERLAELGVRRKTAVEDMDEVDLIAAIKALPEGDPRREPYQRRLDAFGTQRMAEAVSDASTEAMLNDPSIRRVIVKDENNVVSIALARRDEQTTDGRSTYSLPADDNRTVVREMLEGEPDDFQKAVGNINTDERRYTTQRSAVASLLDPTTDILEVIDQNPGAIALGGGVEAGLLNLITNLNSVGDTISNELFNQEAESLGLFDGLGTTNVLGINLDKLRDEGGQAAFVRAKILLMAYKVGAAEGQTGQGMSNKDADRFRTIIRSSSDAATFRKSLVDYVESKIDEVDVAAASILDHPSVKGFDSMYPGSPLYGSFQKPPAREFYGRNDPERWQKYTALSTGASVPTTDVKVEETAAYDPDTVYTFSLEELNANRRNPDFAGAKFFITQEMIDAGLFTQSQLGGQQRFKAP